MCTNKKIQCGKFTTAPKDSVTSFYDVTRRYPTNVTAYEVTDAPYFMAMAENMRSPCDNSTASGVTDGLNATAFGVTDENRGNIRNSKEKQILKLAVVRFGAVVRCFSLRNCKSRVAFNLRKIISFDHNHYIKFCKIE